MIRRRPRFVVPSRRNESRRLFLEGLEKRDLLATVVTDKPDYAPAETALISATDFQVGETVKFQVLHIDGTPNTGNGHQPWSVTDGGAGDLDGLANGHIGTSWFVDPDDSAGATFELSALGLSSGLFATHIFTDAAPPSAGQMNQWDPGNDPDEDWVTGNNDGPYFEGNTVPYYLTLDNLVVGDTYRVTIGWDTTKSGKHAFDYLRTYNQTIAFPPAVDPATDAGLTPDPTPDLLAIPLDPNVPVGIQQPGNFTMYYGDMTGTSAYTLTGTYAGDSTTTISITFVAQDDGVGGAETNVVLIWGGHIATRQDWGPDSSAVSITGSPYHMRLASFFDVTNNEALGGGNQDRSLSAEAVVFPATITIIKNAVPNSLQDFAFTTTGVGLSNFSLDDDAGVVGGDNTLSDTQVFSVTDFTQKTITEAIVAGWNLTNIQITESGTADSTFNLANRLATLNVQEGENITITFTNTQQSSITVVKDAIPNDLANFDFTSTIPGGATFQLDDDAGVGGGDNTLLNTRVFTNPAPGTYTITEAALAGWDLTNLVINDPDGGSSINLATRTATIDVDAGEAITVTFTNTKRGAITVVKDAIPNDLADFSFTSALLGNFQLDDDAGVPGADNTLLNTANFNNLTPGTYIVTESALAGWDLTNLVINDPDNGSSINLATRTATIDLDAGESITVTFTNTKQGGITVIKDAIPNDLADFSFTSALLGNFQLDDDAGVPGADNTLLNTANFNNLTPGTYIVTESALAGWDLTNLVINDPDNGSSINLATRTATIDVDAGESITVTFTNTKRSAITVVKDAIPNDLADFSFTSALLGNFQLDDDAGVPGETNTLLNTANFNNLTPGTYIVTESALAGWDLTNLVINDPDNGSSINLATRTATIDVDAGESITVTFTNTKRGAITVVKDAIPNDLADFSFTSALLGAFQLDDDAGVPGETNTLLNTANFNNLTPGTYIVTESALAGWDLTNLVINDPDNGSSINLATRTATIDVDAGESITVTFTNTKRGAITVVKDAIPNDLADFSFTSALLGNFQLDDDAGVPGATNTLLNTANFNNLTPGTYVVSESALAGWDLTNLVINDPDNGSSINLATRTATIDVDAGEAITVTFTNTKRGAITVVKDAIPNDLADFSFTSALLGNFQLDDDAGVPGADNTLLNTANFNNLTPGTYIVTESALAGWDLTNLVINDPDNGSSINLATRTATIDLDAGESITVTFTNTKRGAITVVKDAIPNDLADFSFTSALLGNFQLDDDAGVPGADNTLLNTANFNNLTPGTYIVTESALAGWDLTNLVISDPDNGSSINLATRTATIDLDPGESITVTFTNTKQGGITVVKDAIPNDLADFTFSRSFGANFQLDDDAGVPGADNTLLNSINFNNLAPGSYTITEQALAGWDLTNLVINDPDNGSSINLATRTATIDLDAGESITVTFTNTKRGAITVVKDAIPNDLADFSFTSALLGNFQLDDDAGVPGATNTLLNTANFNNLTPGTYVVSESALAGWDLTNLVINDPDNGSSINLATRTATIDLDAGESITVTFTNTKRGAITVVKDAIPNDLADFSFTSALLGNFQLDDDAGVPGATNTLLNTANFTNLTPGTYVVSESALAGWDLTNLVINDPDNGSSINLATRTATIDLDAGESITVTFTNTKQGGITVIKDAIPNDLADFSFTSALLGNFQLDDDAGVPGADNTLLNTANFNNLTPGTYIVTESALAGWDLTNLVINDPDNGSSINLATRTATIDLDAGESITVTFTNTKRGAITVVKDAIPNDLADFSFTSALLGNFQLDDDAGVPGATNTLLNTANFNNLTPGTYVVTESALAGWDLTNLVINDPDNGSSINLATRTATIDLDAGESITVTFTNTKRGAITVVKDAIPNDLADFSFTSALLGNFQLDDDAGVVGGDNTLLNTANFNNLTPGTYIVTESALAGWDLTNLVINDPDNGSSINLATRTATIDVDAGEAITVTFTNTKRGRIIVEKQTNPDGSVETFEFDTSYDAANFFLADGQTDDSGLLTPGSYNVAELAEAGWTLANIEIVSGDTDGGSTIGADSDFDLGDTTATIDLDPGEVITVRYTNTQDATVVLRKLTFGGNANFDFNVAGQLAGLGFPVAVNLATTGGVGETAVVTFSNLPAGGQSLIFTELALAGWQLTNVAVLGGDADDLTVNNQATLNVEPGEAIIVAFTNRALGSLTVVKDALPNDAQDFTFDPSANLQAADFNLDDDADATLSNTQAFTSLATGVYSVQEINIPANWTLTNIIVTGAVNSIVEIGGDSDFDPGDSFVSVLLADGENVTITYTNTKRPENVVIGPDKTNASLPYIHVVNSETGEVIARFLAYEEEYRGGVRVATGDLTGDGIAEIVTAPGRGHTPLVRVWDQDGNLLKEFLAFSSTFVGGVDIAVGDVTGDGFNDIATAMNYNGNEVKVFKNTLVAPNPIPTFALIGPTTQHFYPFGSSFKGGATIELADMGTPITVNNIKQLDPVLDGKAELIIGSESGMAPTVKVFSYFGTATVPSLVQTMNPFTPTFHGGMSLDVARVNGDAIPDIIVGAGNGGASQVQILDGLNGNVIGGFFAFTPGDTPSFNAPIDVAARDETGDGIADVIFVAQGSDGAANEIRKFDAQSGTLISSLPESAFDSIFQGNPIDDFAGAYFVATLDDVPLPVIQVEIASLGIKASILPYGPTYFGGVSVATGDLNGDGIEEIVTAPQRNYAPWVRVFDQNGNMLHQFLAYSSTFKGGVDVALGDINGDGKLDIATSMLYGGSQVKTFKNVIPAAAAVLPKTSFSAHSNFYPFGSSFKGGAVVELADMGKPVTVSGVKKLDSTQFDNKAEVVVANGSGMRSTVKAYTYFGTSTTASLVRTFLPLNTTFRGGLSLDLGDVNGDLVPDVLVGAGRGGASQVQVLNGANGGVMTSFQAFGTGEFNANAKLDVEAQDTDFDGIVDFLLAAHDFDGKSREVRSFQPLTGELVDAFFQDYSKV